MDNEAIKNLRIIALDDRVDNRIRLRCCDQLAALANLYSTPRFPTPIYVEPTERGRQFLTKALRRLRKSKRRMAKRMLSGIAQRLLMLRGIKVDDRMLVPPIGRDGKPVELTPAPPEQPVEQPKPAAKNAVVEELEAFLRLHGGV